ncbi:MAG: pyruvate dehydrogenase complex dihydrolipoamide acetyltransferase [Verrucomicrobia bacterium]|nr:pyruvate dehydrogenase complex dihydrolipoamide acetyltransferase [Verrucomicrobiota bacterium]
MPLPIEMPKLSDTMTEGTLVKWQKKVGDKVEMGDVLAEIETDKATMEMEAFDDGTLAEIYVQEGEKVAVGQQIALLALPGDKPGDAAAPRPAAPVKTSAKADSSTVAPPAAPAPVAEVPVPASGAKVKASPLARRIAAARGVDLTRVAGSGPGGRIVQRDVLEAKPGAPAAAPKRPGTPAQPAMGAPAASVQSIPALPAGPNDRTLPLSGMRRVIAERLVASKSTVPHFYLQIEVDAAPLLALRSEINATAEASGRGKITVNDLVIKAVIAALGRVPKVNAAWAGDAIIEYAAINLSVAVAVEDGLVTPVLRDAAGKSLGEISETVKDLATRARTKKLKPEEYQGGTFTLSNLGSYGIESFFAIVNPPQAAILSVGAAVKKPVVNGAGQIVAGQRMTLGLSCDHRVVDGSLGSQFLGELRAFIEKPALMLL